jgi:hypothetical protein
MNSFENLSLSVLLHAAAALIVRVLAIAAPEPKIVAPDRIKIMEIDLNDVKIEGSETKLKNKDAQNHKSGPSGASAEPKKPQPVMKTIKVNREIQSIDRTMTVSVIDALRIAMTRCWQIDSSRADLAEIRAVAHIKLYPNGRVQSYWFEQQPRADTDPTWAYVFETIRLAIDACNPFSMLPRGEYENWKSVQLTFYPTAKIIE